MIASKAPTTVRAILDQEGAHQANTITSTARTNLHQHCDISRLPMTWVNLSDYWPYEEALLLRECVK